MTQKPPSLQTQAEDLKTRIVACERCPRLREYCREVARVRRRAWREWEYWGRPVPPFGEVSARVLLLGLAPGAHGANRTGRIFTGDGSGDFLYPVLYDTGFASQPQSISREDGMKLRNLWISCAVRCAPPDNKPLPEELRNCAPYLDEELRLLSRLRVVVCLGQIAWNAWLDHQKQEGAIRSRAAFPFRHGAEYELPGGLWLLGSYHPSLQNTNTGVLTRPMLTRIFSRARELAQPHGR